MNASFCDNITQIYAPAERYVSQHGEPRNISVYWNSDIARAAAAQLTVILRHALGYQYVHLQDPMLATGEFCYRKPLFQEIKLMVSMTLEPEDDDDFVFDNAIKPTIQETLFVHIAKSLRVKKQCTDADINPEQFYNDISRLTDCGFEISSTSDGHFIYIYHLKANNSTIPKEIPLKPSLIQFKWKAVNRTNLFRMLRTGNQSLLFLDYKIWDGDEDVSIVEQDPYVHPYYFRNKKENDIIITTRMDVECNEDEFASQLFQISKKFSPSLRSLRSILEIESSGQSIEEANCEWISQDRTIIDKIIQIYKPDNKDYKIMTFSCEGNDYELELITTLGEFISQHYFKIYLINYSEDCTNSSYVKSLLNFMSKEITPSHVGVVIGGVKNVTEYEVTKLLDSSPLPVFLFDTIDIDVDLTKSVWLTNGRMIHIVLAIQHFIGNNYINQVTVLSDVTPTAECFNNNLRLLCGSTILGYYVSNNSTLRIVKNILQKIIKAKTNIIILNMNYDNALALLSAAVKLGVNVDKEFTWIFRDWKQTNITLNVTYVTFSLWSRNANDMYITNNWLDIKKVMKTIWPYDTWNPNKMAFIDAVLTLVKGFKDVTLKYPQARDDTQSKYVTQQFERSLAEISPVQVVFQNLTYKGHSPEDAVVFVEKWEGGQQKLSVCEYIHYSANAVYSNSLCRSIQQDYFSQELDLLLETICSFDRIPL
ncbi:unnamed protein product [Arctia plantaginis]|uniref:Uncharacterized protein n=1 Tax=Arctia plantaginis TaxID=874455 RepID=A0A8S1BLD3_ARCPL|nr:unnamed protein product [Arctia plantaginis]